MRFPQINILQQGLWNPKHIPETTFLRFVLSYELEIHHESGTQSVINGASVDGFEGLISFSKPGDLRYSRRSKGTLFNRDFVRFEIESDPAGVFTELLRNAPSFSAMDAEFEHLWREFLSLYAQRKDDQKKLRAYMAFYALLIRLSQKAHVDQGRVAPPSVHQQALFEAICFMRDHMRENLSIGDVAHHIGYSSSHFNHLFKSYTKTTPHAYYQSLRLVEARKMLLRTTLGVSEIADDLSFGNSGKFSQLFKREYGVTPSQFRKLYDNPSVEFE